MFPQNTPPSRLNNAPDGIAVAQVILSLIASVAGSANKMDVITPENGNVRTTPQDAYEFAHPDERNRAHDGVSNLCLRNILSSIS